MHTASYGYCVLMYTHTHTHTHTHIFSPQAVQVGAPYFVAEFDDGPSLFIKIKGRFSLQFGRYSDPCTTTDWL